MTKFNALRPQSRITRKKDFESLRRGAKKQVARHWILFYRENHFSRARIGFSVSTRFGNATQRNRFRRWLKELFRVNKDRFPAMDLHFVAKGTAKKGDNYALEFREDFERLLNRFS